MHTSNIFVGSKDGRCVELTTFQSSCADCLELRVPQPLEPSGPVQAFIGTALPLYERSYLLHNLYPLRDILRLSNQERPAYGTLGRVRKAIYLCKLL
jgi:hypothetical protein